MLATMFLPFVNTTTPDIIAPGVKAGITLGYILYDMIHYFIHHSSPKSGYFKQVKLYHMQHHYKDG